MKNKKTNLVMNNRLRVTLRRRFILPLISLTAILYLVFYFNLGIPKVARAGTESITTGSFIINMGVTPQTYSNGLRPYGMIYDLMVNYKVPIKWIIDPTKAKDGTDFTYSGVNYKGGCFIVPKENISGAVTGRIAYWTAQGVVGLYTTSGINVPVYATLTTFPRIIIDTISNKETIITNYFDNAMIPATAYQTGSPSLLSFCHDLWINPHGDPTWATHGYLYDLVTVAKSYVWMECHAVSVTEGIKNSASPFQQLNFLSTTGLKCYSSSKCGVAAETHAGTATGPFTHSYPTDPVMQFMGTMDGACDGGSEKWNQPLSTGAWRSTTKRLVTTATGTSPNEGSLMAYGPAYGDTTNGYVMYVGGHDIDGNGTTVEKVAAQRAFFNFVLLTGSKKQLAINSVTVPVTGFASQEKDISVAVGGGSPPYDYTWTNDFGATFINNKANTTKLKFPATITSLSGNVTCVITDACSRQNFAVRPVTAFTTLPIKLKTFNPKFIDNHTEIVWVTASEINNDYFTLERSSNGINFIEIGRVKGSGNSTSDIHYNFVDYEPVEGINYYRLKQTDFDGQFTYSEIKTIRKNKDGLKESGLKIESIYPNPFADNFSLQFRLNNSAEVKIVLISATGQIISDSNFEAVDGVNTYDFNSRYDLAKGIYYLAIINNQEKIIQKIIKN